MRHISIGMLAAVSVITLAQLASAADLPVKAPAYVQPRPAPVYNWTGFYIGGNVGYGWGNANTSYSADPITITTNVGIATIPGFAGSESARLKGIIGGGQIGYNWQFSPNWIAGIEADIQASGAKGSNAFTNSFSFASVPGLVTGTAATSYDAKIEWFGTVRGRVGYAWDRLMIYATGGLAYGEVKVDGIRTVTGTVGAIPFSISKAIGHSQTRAGWTLGAGVEGALADHWTWKAEYLYVDLGSLYDADAVAPPTLISVTGGQTFTHTHFTDNILRVGVNYKFY